MDTAYILVGKGERGTVRPSGPHSLLLHLDHGLVVQSRPLMGLLQVGLQCPLMLKAIVCPLLGLRQVGLQRCNRILAMLRVVLVWGCGAACRACGGTMQRCSALVQAAGWGGGTTLPCQCPSPCSAGWNVPPPNTGYPILYRTDVVIIAMRVCHPAF